MKRLFCALTLLLFMFPAPGQAGKTNYDMSSLLFEAHPFASNAPLAPVIAGPRIMPQRARSTTPRRAAPQPPRQPVRQPVQPIPRPVKAAAAPAPYYPQKAAANPVSGASDGLWNVLSEVRIGALVHDIGPFSSNEEDGFDGNFELLFVSPDFLEIIWAPRPHVGLSVNSSGDTSQVYAGLSWEWSFWRYWFAGFSLGGSVHDGKFTTNRIDRKELGCRVLFRESIEVGYRFAGKHSISGFLDHISNANICDKNEGLETTGIRYGYKF